MKRKPKLFKGQQDKRLFNNSMQTQKTFLTWNDFSLTTEHKRKWKKIKRGREKEQRKPQLEDFLDLFSISGWNYKTICNIFLHTITIIKS